VGNSLRLIAIDAVIYFQSDNKYTRVVLIDSEVLIKRTLKELLTELDPEQFWQIHRSTVVNALEIAAIEPNLGGQLVGKLKTRREQFPVSDSFIQRFRKM
jgi:DNA-binding LytR/AlgR family response regulator